MHHIQNTNTMFTNILLDTEQNKKKSMTQWLIVQCVCVFNLTRWQLELRGKIMTTTTTIIVKDNIRETKWQLFKRTSINAKTSQRKWKCTLRSVSREALQNSWIQQQRSWRRDKREGNSAARKKYRVQKLCLLVTGLMTMKNTVKLFVITFQTQKKAVKVQDGFDVTSTGNMVTGCCPWTCLQSTTAQEATGAINSTYSTQSQVTLSLEVKFGKKSPQKKKKMAFLSIYHNACLQVICSLSTLREGITKKTVELHMKQFQIFGIPKITNASFR